MPRLFFTTVGLSTLHHLPPELKKQNINKRHLNEVCRYLTMHLKAVYRQNPKNVLNYSAELRSLLKKNLTAQDVVEFVSSDTDKGRVCADVLAELIKSEIGCETRVSVIEGLQVNNPNVFRNQGVVNYLEHFLSVRKERRYTHKIIMNLTGGFKSIVPYSTIVAMVFGIPVFYVFEFSEQLIELPPLPISLDFTLMKKYQERFELLAAEGAIPEEHFYRGMNYEERQRIKLVVEQERRLVTLSGLGLIMWEAYGEGRTFLVESDLHPDDKSINIANHHGKDRLIPIANKLKRCPYVESILYSDEYQPQSSEFVQELIEPNRVRVVDINTDPGYSMVVETTARNRSELELIAERLQDYYS